MWRSKLFDLLNPEPLQQAGYRFFEKIKLLQNINLKVPMGLEIGFS
jgi:hypothetical protein